MFVHNAAIPITFAMSVHRIMHGLAHRQDWDTLDKIDKPTAIRWIVSILEDNNTPDIEAEIAWWNRELKTQFRS